MSNKDVDEDPISLVSSKPLQSLNHHYLCDLRDEHGREEGGDDGHDPLVDAVIAEAQDDAHGGHHAHRHAHQAQHPAQHDQERGPRPVPAGDEIVSRGRLVSCLGILVELIG